MKIRDARAAAAPPPDEVEFADDANPDADDDEFAEEAQLAADYDEADDTEPVDAEPLDEITDPPDPVEDVDKSDEIEVEDVDKSDESDDIDVDDVAEEVPEQPELLAEDAALVDDAEGTLPRDVPAPEEEALHEVDPDELLASADEWRDRWDQVQLGFVDQPLDAVESAGRMVAEVLDEMARAFAARRREIEARWSEADQISTDDLRQVFLRYRELFNRVMV